MLFKKYLNSFISYNILLVIFFSLSVTSIESISFLNSLSFVIFHFIIIYLSLYYYRLSLYIIFFLFGLATDLFLIHQIGPHLLTFMCLLLIISQIIKILKKFNYTKMYLVVIFIQFLLILIEMILSQLLFNYKINLINYFNLVFISLISSYPILLFLNKIDKIKL